MGAEQAVKVHLAFFVRRPALQGNAFKDWRFSAPQIYILKGLQLIARGRGAIATTTPGWVTSWIRTLKGVPEAPEITGPRTLLRPTIGVETLCLQASPGGRSEYGLLLRRGFGGQVDPGLISPIPTGIKNRTAVTQSLKALPFREFFRAA